MVIDYLFRVVIYRDIYIYVEGERERECRRETLTMHTPNNHISRVNV